MEEKVACRTPAEGRDGMTNIPKWKFDALQGAILTVLRRGELPFSELREAVRVELDEETLNKLGSLGWHVTSVKLEMEVRGEIERVAGKLPQRLQLPLT